MSAAKQAPKTLLEEMATLEAALAGQEQRVREIRRAQEAALAAVAGLKETVLQLEVQSEAGRAVGDKLAKAKGNLELAQANLAVRDFGREFTVAEKALQVRQWDLAAFCTANADGLIGEIAPDAHAAAAGVTDALHRVLDSIGEWQQVEKRVDEVLRRAEGRAPAAEMRAMTWPVTNAIRDQLGDVPLPLPRGAQTISIAPTSDPDDEVRERARRRVKAA